MIVTIPDKLTVYNLNQRIPTLEKAFTLGLKTKTVIFDFSECTELCPTAITYIGMWRDIYKEKEIKTVARVKNKVFRSFLTGIKLIDIPNEEDTVFKPYMLELSRCYSVAECRKVQTEIIERLRNERVLDKESISAIDYMLNEIWDNAGVHGYKCYEESKYPKPVYICGYSYHDCFELAIADNGQGIHDSLKNNPKYRFSTAQEALKDSIKKGVSGHPQKSPGFGLYCSSEFMRRSGCSLSINSSGANLVVDEKIEKLYKSAFKRGTIITISFSKKCSIPFGEILDNKDIDEYIETMIDGAIL